MKKTMLLLPLITFIFYSPVSAQNKGMVFVSFNPYKLFIGLINAGVEYQISRDHSVYLSAEKAFYRSDYLKRIRHPDGVITSGYRFYIPPDGENGSRPFTGASVSLVHHAGSGQEAGRFHLWLGAELGYRWLPDENTAIAPRGIVNYNLAAKKFIFGAEVQAGTGIN